MLDLLKNNLRIPHNSDNSLEASFGNSADSVSDGTGDLDLESGHVPHTKSHHTRHGHRCPEVQGEQLVESHQFSELCGVCNGL